MRTSGTGSAYRDARGLWRASLELPRENGKRRRRYFSASTKRGVMSKLAEAQKQLATDGWLPGTAPTLDAYARHWMDDVVSPGRSPKTAASYSQHLRDHILPLLGSKRLDTISPQDVRNLYAACREKGLSSSTVRLIGVTLSGLLKSALRSELVTRNVCDAVERPAPAAHEVKLPDAASAARLLRAMSDDPLALRWWLALLTGARKSEVLGVETGRVSRAGDSVDIAWQLQRVPSEHGCTIPCGHVSAGRCPDAVPKTRPDGQPMRQIKGSLWLKGPKTASSTRVIPIAEPLQAPLLTAVVDAQRTAVAVGHELLWRPPHGGAVLSPDQDSRLWERLRIRAGCESMRLHDVRHLAATAMLEQGVDVKVIQSILGHSTAVMTRHYQHVDLTEARRAVDALAQHTHANHGINSRNRQRKDHSTLAT